MIILVVLIIIIIIVGIVYFMKNQSKCNVSKFNGNWTTNRWHNNCSNTSFRLHNGRVIYNGNNCPSNDVIKCNNNNKLELGELRNGRLIPPISVSLDYDYVNPTSIKWSDGQLWYKN